MKEQYYFELNRRQQIEGAVTLPIAVLTGLTGVAFSFVKLFAYSSGYLTYIFLVCVLAAFLALIAAFYYIVRVMHRYKYLVLPSCNDLLAYSTNNKAYYRALNRSESEAEKEFEDELERSYAEAASVNMENNISRAAFLYRANIGLVLGVIFMALSAVPFTVSEARRPRDVQRIETVNFTQTEKPPGGNMSEDQPKVPQQPTKPAEPTKKPQFPPNVVTRQGDQPKEK